MKVLMVNSSPHTNGCTFRALSEMQKVFTVLGIESEIISIGHEVIRGCIACNGCLKTKRCVFNDKVNEFLEKAQNSDGFVFGTPVYYAGMSGTLTSFMDRAFYGKGDIFRFKPACGVVSARRAGTGTTFDAINKYFAMNQMPIVTSTYWNNVHGAKPEDVEFDKEGLATMRNLARNMVWLIKCINNSNEPKPEWETPERTNFIKNN